LATLEEEVMVQKRYGLLLAASFLSLSSCASKTGTGAVVGTVGGAVVGGAVGAAAGSTAKGAIIGAVVGGAAGAIIGSQMDKQAREIKDIKGAKVERVGEGIQVTFESGLLYDFDSDVVRPEAKTNLRELAASLEKYPNTDLLIVGHTDQLGSATYNQSLSERRARSAATYLVAQGVSGARIVTRGLGETEPVASNETEAGRQANRRVEVAIYASKEFRASAGKPGSQ
jgi:outer membrane protein OmpA-like peptidoglycan-associated protein